MESPLAFAIDQERKHEREMRCGREREVFERCNGPGNKKGAETLEEDQTVVNILILGTS